MRQSLRLKCHSRWTEMLRRTRWISCSLVQKEHSWMNRVRTTVLMVICKDDGNLSATEVCVEMVLRNVTLCLTGHYQEDDDLAREQFRRFGRKLATYSASASMPNTDRRFRSSVSKYSESCIIKRSCSNTKWSTKCQTPAKKSLKDSGHRKGLQNV